MMMVTTTTIATPSRQRKVRVGKTEGAHTTHGVLTTCPLFKGGRQPLPKDRGLAVSLFMEIYKNEWDVRVCVFVKKGAASVGPAKLRRDRRGVSRVPCLVSWLRLTRLSFSFFFRPLAFRHKV
jgi:hypothetical protein